MSESGGFPPPTKKQARILWLSVTSLSVGILLGLLGLLMWGMGFVLNLLAPVIWPLAIAGVAAYLLDPVVGYFERKRIKRFWAILLTYLVCVIVFLCLLVSIIPTLVYQGQEMINDFPRYTRIAKTNVVAWIEKSPWKGTSTDGTNDAAGFEVLTITNDVSTNALPTNIVVVVTNTLPATNAVFAPEPTHPEFFTLEVGEKLLNWATRVAPRVGVILKNTASRLVTWGGMMIGLALVPVFCFYFLLEKRSIRAGWADYLPVQESWFKDELVFVISAINEYLIVFFRGQVLVALCDGILFSIGFLAVGLNYAILIGLVAGMLSIVPYLGAILTIIPAVVLAIVQFQDWLHPILVVVVFSVVQALEGFVISPKIMGDRVGLHPFTIILAVLIGSLLMGGILGGILAIPLTAALRVLMFRYVWKKPEPEQTAA